MKPFTFDFLAWLMAFMIVISVIAYAFKREERKWQQLRIEQGRSSHYR